MTRERTHIDIPPASDIRSDTRVYMTCVEDLSAYFNVGTGSFEGYLPANIVERDAHLPFKSERTDELVEDLKLTRERDGWGNGQDSPMLAAYITGEVEPSVEVYDGLHRQVANIVFQERHGIETGRPAHVLSAIGNMAIHFVTVKPMSRRDMLDKRLTNTRNHPELRFARGGLWSAQLWYLDDISTLAPGLSAKQAFNLAERNTKNNERLGDRLGLTPDIVDQVAEWAIRRAEAWSVDPSTVYKWILRAEATTPAIIAQVRNVGKGGDGRGIVTESMITSIAHFMAGEQYHDSQSMVISFALQNELSDIQFSNLLAEIMSTPKITDASNIDQVLDYLDELEIGALNSDTKAVSHRRIRRRTDIFSKGSAAVTSVGDAIDRVAESLDVRDEREHFVPDIDQRRAAIEAAEELEAQAEKAWALAERARMHAFEGAESDIHSGDESVHIEVNITGTSVRRKQFKFRNAGGQRKFPTVSEAYAPQTTADILHQIREVLPEIKNDALQDRWGANELDDALEIVTVIAEVLARLSGISKTKTESVTHDIE